eukprot:443091-Prymnesium_polylepis.1
MATSAQVWPPRATNMATRTQIWHPTSNPPQPLRSLLTALPLIGRLVWVGAAGGASRAPLSDGPM